MDRKIYLQIRKDLNLALNESALASHYLRECCFVALIAFFWNYFPDSLLRFIAIPVLAALIFRNFSLMHEAVHKAVSKNSLLNYSVGILAGAVCLLPFEPWRRSHLEHHTWTGNTEKDPVTAIITVFPKFPSSMRKTLNFFWNVWFPMLAIMQYIVFWVLAAKIFIKNRSSAKVFVSLLAPVVTWTAAFTLLPTEFVFTVLVPSLALFMVAVEVVNFPHHLQLPQYRGEVRFPVWEQHQVARSCTYPKWFSRWVVLNFNYHIEHHMFPEVPWYHLEKLHSKVRPHLSERYNSDPYLKWVKDNRPLPLESVLKAANSNVDQSSAVSKEAA